MDRLWVVQGDRLMIMLMKGRWGSFQEIYTLYRVEIFDQIYVNEDMLRH